ncbi:MAG: SCO family protein [Fimbriimonadia bacterium]|jgi:protein SCO1/2
MKVVSRIAALWLLCVACAISWSQGADDITREVALDQRLGNVVPADIPFVDENGNAVRIGDYFGDKPIVLALVWYKCPGICIAIEEGMILAFREQSFQIGKDYKVLSVSIASEEGPELAKAKQEDAIERYGKPEGKEGWHFLTGTKESIAKLASTVGYRFMYDAKTHQYAHPAGLIVLTPQGKVSHYFYGVEFRPRDLRLALVSAGGGKIGTPVDKVLLTCYHVDLTTGKYNLAITRILQITGGITVAVLFGSIFYLSKRYRTRVPSNGGEEPAPDTA